MSVSHGQAPFRGMGQILFSPRRGREERLRFIRDMGVKRLISLTGVLSGLAAVLAENGIAIFAVSTYNTDYILVKRENFQKALKALSGAGYKIVPSA